MSWILELSALGRDHISMLDLMLCLQTFPISIPAITSLKGSWAGIEILLGKTLPVTLDNSLEKSCRAKWSKHQIGQSYISVWTIIHFWLLSNKSTPGELAASKCPFTFSLSPKSPQNTGLGINYISFSYIQYAIKNMLIHKCHWVQWMYLFQNMSHLSCQATWFRPQLWLKLFMEIFSPNIM